MSLATLHYAGADFVPAYQAAGVPFVQTVTNATKTIDLKYVTSEITVSASGGAGTVSFGLTNSANFTIPSGETVTFRIRAKKIVMIAGSGVILSCVAALTPIKAGEIATFDQADYGRVS